MLQQSWCWEILKHGNGTQRFFGKQCLLAYQQWLSRFTSKGPENKGALLYLPLQADYRSEKQTLTHIGLPVISLATSSSVLRDSFQVLSFFKFQFPAMLSPPPLYIIPLFDAQTLLGSKSIILI
jgi:hypothetical protein